MILLSSEISEWAVKRVDSSSTCSNRETDFPTKTVKRAALQTTSSNSIFIECAENVPKIL